jgi:hypothetical protein
MEEFELDQVMFDVQWMKPVGTNNDTLINPSSLTITSDV